MKKAIIIAASALLIIALCVYLFLVLPSEKKLEAVRNMKIENVNLEEINDGTYAGEYGYGSFTYKVEVKVKDHKLEKINIISNRDTTHAKKAEGVIINIIEKQSLDVEAVSGATTTSKALLKAVENALNSSSIE